MFLALFDMICSVHSSNLQGKNISLRNQHWLINTLIEYNNRNTIGTGH